jgi:hypothetical protein
MQYSDPFIWCKTKEILNQVQDDEHVVHDDDTARHCVLDNPRHCVLDNPRHSVLDNPRHSVLDTESL